MITESLETLKSKLAQVQYKISKIEGVRYYTDKVAESFHLGMVGGSGRNTARLNQRREADLEKTISNAVALQPLYRERSLLEYKIKDIESGGAANREEKKKQSYILLAQYWNNIKAGDKLDIGGNAPVEVTKKSRKSLEAQGVNGLQQK